MREIGRNGTVITEYPPFAKPIGKHFPLRNRIICGLSQCTVVFEADDNSGSLITAEYARKQGRSVYAVPGKVGELNSLGTNKLIKSGAKMATSAIDILKEFDFLYPKTTHPEKLIPLETEKRRFISGLRKKKKTGEDTEKAVPSEEKREKSKPAKTVRSAEEDAIIETLSESERLVLSSMSRIKPVTAEQLGLLGLPVSSVLTALTTLEIMGLIEARPGGAYIRKM